MSDDIRTALEQGRLAPHEQWKAADTLDARDAEIARLREALEDAIRSPKGVVPDSVALIRRGGNDEV